MSNLRFYSQGLDNAVVASDKGDAAGHPIQHLQDRLLDTYWESGSAADQNINIDLGAATDIDYCLLYHNMTLTTDISVWSAVASNYSDEVQRSPSYAAVDATIMLMELAATHKYRYWRIKLANCVTAPKIYLAFLGLKKEITVRYDKGYTDRTVYDGSLLVETFSGKRYSRRNSIAGRRRLEYSWDKLDSVNAAKLQALVTDSQGMALPFYIRLEDDSYLYARLMADSIPNPEAEYLLYDISKVVFEEEK
jgi:hypothetical protein